MLRIQNVKYLINPNIKQPTYDELIDYLYKYISKKYQPKNLRNIKLIKKSIDARTSDLYYVMQAIFNVDNESKLLKDKNITKYTIPEELIYLENLKIKTNKKVLIVGMGPSGLFNAYVLSNAGYQVTLIDRGSAIEERVKDVDAFLQTGRLNVNSNIQFGEGGAGTFSDGKLGTNISSPYTQYVLETFVKFNAPLDILYEAKPHIGTNILREVIVNFRNYLIQNGVKILFNTKLVDFDQQFALLENNGDPQKEPYEKLVLAVGHSATDIYELLKHKKVEMEPKNFAVGVRIEHPQKAINEALYHGDFQHLSPAEYKLVVHLADRSVYTFCMCPGGFVVNAASEEGYLVTNGMSNYERNENNANSAVLVNVNIADYYHGDVLDGVYFLKEYERKAYLKYGNYLAPVQLVKDFLNNIPSYKLGSVIPSIKPGYKLGSIDDVLPSFVSDSLKKALPILDKKLHGFADGDAVLTAIETRSSAPVRIKRKDNFETSLKNVFAIGEGSGYAGGITTSAIDGIKIAIKIIENDQEEL